ncbi:hypothetical protein [Polymorphospora rubra]|uniref:hypothetical protein n=1 Tax=Polymorphospora rubra TaxID=338584 RepID=UPI0034103E6E
MTSADPNVDATADRNGGTASHSPDHSRRSFRLLRIGRAHLGDLVAYGTYLALGVLVMGRLWLDPYNRVLTGNEDDHGLHMFLIAHSERVIFHFENPLWSERLGVPDGVNMMSNTSMMALGIPVSPITHFFGAAVSVVLLLTLSLAGTAAAWYWVLSRHFVRSRAAAYIGGLWCGFAPTMISHANGHINFVAHFLVPFIVWRALKLREPGRVVRNSVILAVFIVLQIFINEEALLFAAMALGVFVLSYAAMRPAEAKAALRPMLAGLGVTAVLSFVVLAYPLWWQFFGPGHYRGLPYDPDAFVTDLAAYPAFARQSLAGDPATVEVLSNSPTEDNSFFGWPVLILLAVAVPLIWRSVASRAVLITGLFFAVISLGPTLVYKGEDTGIKLPFWLISEVPVIDLVSVTRFAIVATFAAGVVLALAADRIMDLAPDTAVAGHRIARPAKIVWWVALVAAFIPVAPLPAPVRGVEPLPDFIASGQWRPYVPEGRTLVPVPLADVTRGRLGMRWSALSDLEFQAPRGYFMGPADPPHNIDGSWGQAQRPTSLLLQEVSRNGVIPPIGEAERQAAREDLIYWRAGVVVLGEQRRVEELRVAMTELMGEPPQRVDDVWLWDVRDLPVPPKN